MGAPLWEGSLISLGSDLLTEIFQCFTPIRSDVVDTFEGYLETSENMKHTRILSTNQQP